MGELGAWLLPGRRVRKAMALIPLPQPSATATWMAALAFIAGCGVAQAATEMAGAVVVIDGVPAEGVLEAAQDQLPARWRLELLHPEARPPRAPRAEVELLARAYLNADFLHCLTELQRPSLDVDRLLEEGRRTEAAEVGIIAAACSMGAGDEGRAREIVRRLLVRELEEPDVMRKTTPEFQRLADEERLLAQRLPRVTVEIKTDPVAASVAVDGAVRCPVSPCRVHVLRGEHVLVAEKLGQRRRSLTALLDTDQTLTVALDPAAAEEIHHQLLLDLGAGADPSGPDIVRAAATAYGVGLLALVWRKGDQVHANVFQRSGGAITHVALDATGPNPAARAVAAALREWRSESQPRSMLRQPLFWATAVGVALASAAAVYFLIRPLEPNHGIVFTSP